MNFAKILVSAKKVTFKEANMKYIKYLGYREHLLRDNETKRLEIWFSNKDHASFGLIYKNTHLEYARGARKDIDIQTGELIYC